MKHLKIKNWDKWQTYRADRGQPPWIKIHRRIMRNPEWVSLSDAERGQLVCIWLLAADHDGVIPASTELIQKLCFMENPPNINKFIDLDFICQNDATVTPERRQDDQPKAEAKAEAKADKVKNSLDFEIFYKTYPKKKSRGQAEKTWLKLSTTNNFPKLEILLSAIEKQKKSKEWQKDNGKFIPHPSTWLNAKGWLDETTVEPEIEYEPVT